MAAPNFWRIDWTAQTAYGLALAGAQVFVCTQPAVTTAVPPTPLASLFTDSTGATPLANPLVCNGFGQASGYVSAGTYTVVVVNNGLIVGVFPDQSFGVASASASFSISGNSPIIASALTSLASATANTVLVADGAGNVEPNGSGVLISNGNVITPGLNNIVYANAFSGSDAGAQIAAAYAALPASGGIVDARGILGSQTVTSGTISIGTASKPCILLLGQVTLISTSNPVLSVTVDGSWVIGASPNLTIIANNGSGADAIHWTASNGGIRDLQILGGAGSGSGLVVSATSTAAVEFNEFDNLKLSGPQNSNSGIKLLAFDGSHLCSFNSFRNISVVDYLTSLDIDTASSVGATDNSVLGCQFRKTSQAGTGILINNGQSNTFVSLDVSNHSTGISLTGANAASNDFIGIAEESNATNINAASNSADNHFFGGTIPTWTDNGNRNTFWVTNNAVGPGGAALLQLSGGNARATVSTGTISIYNGITTAGQGVPPITFADKATALAANYNSGSAKTIVTSPTAGSMFRISGAQMLTQAASSSSTFPSLTLGWTDAGGIARTLVLVATSTTNATTVITPFSTVIYVNGTNVTLTSASYASSGGTPMQYALAYSVEQLQ